MLERLATLEEDDATARRAALGEAARLAAQIGENERSVTAWETRLKDDTEDLEALDGLVDVLVSAGKVRALVDALLKRASVRKDAAASREDRVRAARILSTELDAPDEAIDVWQNVREASGDADDADAALAELYEQRERWKDLAELLARASERHEDRETKSSLLARLGDVQRAKLDEPKRAIESYAQALDARPGDAQAFTGLTALLDVKSAARKALDVLLSDHSATDAWQKIVALLPQRLRLAKDDDERVANLLQTAELFEKRANDLEAAFHASREAFTIAGGVAEVAATAERLSDAAAAAGAPDVYRAFADAHRAVLEGLEGSRKNDDADVLRLRTKLGALLETHLDDPRGALVQFTRVANDEPTNADAALSLIRVAGRVARWDAAATLVLDRAVAASERRRDSDAGGGPDETLVHALEDAASAHAGWDALTAAFEAAIAQRTELPREAARDLEARLATWHRDRRADAEAAEAAYARALTHDPNDTRLLAQLAQLQRRHRGRPLIDSLLRLSQATGGDPELLHEAAEVAARVVVDCGLAKSILDRLLKLASERWTSSDEQAPATLSPGEAPPSVGPSGHPSEHVEWALAELLRVHNEEGNAERIVELLESAAKLPFTRERSRELLHEAGRTALDCVGDAQAAQRLYARLFEEEPRDDEAASRLADVYASLGRKDDLLAVRKKQIAVASEAAVRVAHRLEAALLERELGRIDEATTSLRDNLVDAPRHARTTLVLSETLEGAGHWDELSAFCAEQAGLAEADGDALSAVELWSRAASIAEEKLGHWALALSHYKRALALELRAQLLDAIARIHEHQSEWVDAAANLDRLVREFPEQRAAVIVRLADAFSKGGRDDAAQERLEAAMADPSSPADVAQRLAAIYRRTSQFAPLGELIARQAEGAKTDADRRALLVEAADIFLGRCAQPDRAVPLLEQACALAPDDRPLKLRLAEALQDAGSPDRARALLREMIDAFAGRRPKERATVHFYLARLHLRIGERAQALAELEAATRIDPANPEILRMVAELARDDGQLDKAERSYRALLAVVRRAEDDAPVLRTEVLVELAALAERQGEPERAAEIIESAFETAATSDAEAKRLEKALRTRGNTQGLLRSLRSRLERAQSSEARAEVLAELARSHDELGDHEAALRAYLDALAEVPSSAPAHDAAMALATKLGKTDAYIETVTSLADRATASNDARTSCSLLLRAGDALARSEGGASRAAEILVRAKKTGAMAVDVLRALDRVYATLGDAESQEATLSELAALEVESTSRDPRAASDILYRLADLRARKDATVDDAARSLSTALDLAPDAERAATIADGAISWRPRDARDARRLRARSAPHRTPRPRPTRRDAPGRRRRRVSRDAARGGDAHAASRRRQARRGVLGPSRRASARRERGAPLGSPRARGARVGARRSRGRPRARARGGTALRPRRRASLARGRRDTRSSDRRRRDRAPREARDRPRGSERRVRARRASRAPSNDRRRRRARRDRRGAPTLRHRRSRAPRPPSRASARPRDQDRAPRRGDRGPSRSPRRGALRRTRGRAPRGAPRSGRRDERARGAPRAPARRRQRSPGRFWGRRALASPRVDHRVERWPARA